MAGVLGEVLVRLEEGREVLLVLDEAAPADVGHGVRGLDEPAELRGRANLEVGDVGEATLVVAGRAREEAHVGVAVAERAHEEVVTQVAREEGVDEHGGRGGAAGPARSEPAGGGSRVRDAAHDAARGAKGPREAPADGALERPDLLAKAAVLVLQAGDLRLELELLCLEAEGLVNEVVHLRLVAALRVEVEELQGHVVVVVTARELVEAVHGEAVAPLQELARVRPG